MKNMDFIESSGNVFVDLGFKPDEAAVMLIRVEIAIHISHRIKETGWTLDEVARQLSVTLPQASQLAKTKIDDFSLDTLWILAVRLGIPLELTLSEK